MNAGEHAPQHPLDDLGDDEEKNDEKDAGNDLRRAVDDPHRHVAEGFDELVSDR